jgi:hypothetical protein
VNALLKSRVRENLKHGSVRAFITIKLLRRYKSYEFYSTNKNGKMYYRLLHSNYETRSTTINTLKRMHAGKPARILDFNRRVCDFKTPGC